MTKRSSLRLNTLTFAVTVIVIILVVVGIGQWGLPRLVRISEHKRIVVNLECLNDAALQYCLENGTRSAPLSELMGPASKYAPRPIIAVGGESYPDPVELIGPLIAVDEDGERVRFDRPSSKY